MDSTSLIAPSDAGCIHQCQGNADHLLDASNTVINVQSESDDQNQNPITNPELDTNEDTVHSSETSNDNGPTTAWGELKLITKLAIPVCLTSIARVVMWNTDQIFLGHLGTKQLAGASLADTCSDMITFLVYSPAWSLNGLCSQAIGSGNRLIAGYWLQLTVMLCTLICIPVSIGYFFVSDLIGLWSQDPVVIHYSGQFAHFAVLLLWTNAMLSSIRLYHQSLEIVTPFTIISLIAIVFNIGANQLWIHGFHSNLFGGHRVDIEGLGFIGSPLATSSSFMLQLTLCFVWCFMVKKYHIVHETWSGWSLKETVFHGKRVMELLKVVVPITISNCSENWAYQAIVLYSAKLEAAEIAAMTCTFAVWGILWSFYNGFGVSIVTRVGKKIGSGQIAEAKLSAKMGLLLSLIACTSTASIVYLLSNEVATIYSNDPEVIQLMKQCVRLVCITYVVGGSGWAAMAVLEAMSKNKAKGIINVLCAWCGYAPACIFLMTSENNQYIGLPKACSVFVVGLVVEFVRSTLLWIVVLRTDWNVASEEAKKRNERYDDMMGNESKEDGEENEDKDKNEERYMKLEDDDGGTHGDVEYRMNKEKHMSVGGAYDLMENVPAVDAATSA